MFAALYSQYCDDALARMRGMFAIAIWDDVRRRLVLARDRVGKKPLYFMQDGDRFLFASEPKAILVALARVPDISPAALIEFLTFGYIGGTAGIFTGMQRLEPGSILVVEPPAIGCSARRIPQRRARFGGGARADDKALAATGQDVFDRLRRSRVRRTERSPRYGGSVQCGSSRMDGDA